MATSTIATPTYLLEQDAREFRRLILQSETLNPFTRRLLADAGIAEGMRVLDAGCGARDVALLVAEMVGPSGAVLGVDRSGGALSVARSRSEAMGLTNVSFREGDLVTMARDGDFDAIVARLVLIHAPDPAALLRALTRYLRPGGIVAFQEWSFPQTSFRCAPSLNLWHQYWGWIRRTMECAGVQKQIGDELHRIFPAAGLPLPQLRLEAPVLVGPDPGPYEWSAETLRSMLPMTEKLGIATADEVGIDTLAERLRTETLAANAVVKFPDLISAWTRAAGA